VGLFAFQFLQGYVNVSLGGAFERNPDLPLIAKFLISVASGIGVLWFIKISSQAERRIPPPLQAAGGMRPCI
jgi:hypothetical protein